MFMSNDKKKFQKLSDDSMEKAAGGKLHVEQEKGLWNLGGLLRRYHIYDDEIDPQTGEQKLNVHNLSQKQAKEILTSKGYELKGVDPFTDEE